jgi:phosphoglycerol transferase MdoB-like AlkP superfamily enzyme
MVFYDALIITFVRYVEKIKNTPLHCLDTSNRCYFLLLMSFLRWLLVIIFKTNISKTISLKAAYWLGFRYDLRIVAIVMMLLFIVGSIPALHPINKKWGRRIALTIWTLFIIVLCVFYAVDFGYYAYLQQRVNANVLSFLQDAKISFSMMWQSYRLGWNSLALIGAILLLRWLVQLSYNFILSKSNYSTKKSSIVWGLVFVLFVGYSIVGRVVVKGGQFPLRWSDAFSLGSDYAANVALNPFQSFFSTLSFREATYNEQKVREHYDWMSSYLGVTEKDSTKLNFSRTIVPDASDTTSKNTKCCIGNLRIFFGLQKFYVWQSFKYYTIFCRYVQGRYIF